MKRVPGLKSTLRLFSKVEIEILSKLEGKGTGRGDEFNREKQKFDKTSNSEATKSLHEGWILPSRIKVKITTKTYNTRLSWQ